MRRHSEGSAGLTCLTQVFGVVGLLLCLIALVFVFGPSSAASSSKVRPCESAKAASTCARRTALESPTWQGPEPRIANSESRAERDGVRASSVSDGASNAYQRPYRSPSFSTKHTMT